MRTARTRSRASWLFAAALLLVTVLVWPRVGSSEPRNEVSLQLTEVPVALAVSASSGRIAIAGPNSIELRDRSGGLLNSFVFGAMPEGCCVRDLAFVGDELFIARSPSWLDREGAGGTLGGLYRWSGDADETPVDLPIGGCTDVAVAAESAVVATACAGAVQLWTIGDQALHAVVHDRPAAAIALNEAGTILAVADGRSGAAGAGEGETAPASLRLYALGDQPEQVAESDLADADIRQLVFLADDRLLTLDASGAIAVVETEKMTADLIVENGPAAADAGARVQIAVGAEDRLLAGDLSGARGGVLVDLATGTAIDSDAAIPMRGAGQWAFVDDTTLLWAGRPPTFPTAVLRWFDLPTVAAVPEPRPAELKSSTIAGRSSEGREVR